MGDSNSDTPQRGGNRAVRTGIFIVVLLIFIPAVWWLIDTGGLTRLTPTPIAELKDDPGAYDEQPVTVRGTVTRTIKLPLVEWKLYYLRDDTGEILVWTDAALPRKDEERTVNGVFKLAFDLGMDIPGVGPAKQMLIYEMEPPD